jgi:thiol-disulfide isomerase/thioredoxin
LAGLKKSWTAEAFGLAVTKLGTGAFLVLASLLVQNLSAQAQGFDVQPWPAKKPIPAFEATDLSGKVWHSSDLRGRAVLINFWASWCEPCRAEMPSLQALAQRHGPEKLLVLAVNFKEPLPTVQRFADKSALSLPVLLDPQGTLTRQWGVSIFPSTVLLGIDGRVQGVLRGELDWTGAQATQLIAPLLIPPLKQR